MGYYHPGRIPMEYNNALRSLMTFLIEVISGAGKFNCDDNYCQFIQIQINQTIS